MLYGFSHRSWLSISFSLILRVTLYHLVSLHGQDLWKWAPVHFTYLVLQEWRNWTVTVSILWHCADTEIQNRIKPDYLHTKQLAWLKCILITSVLNIQIPCLRLLRNYPTEANLSFYLHACLNVPWIQNTTHGSIFLQRRVAWCITLKCNLNIHNCIPPGILTAELILNSEENT